MLQHQGCHECMKERYSGISQPVQPVTHFLAYVLLDRTSMQYKCLVEWDLLFQWKIKRGDLFLYFFCFDICILADYGSDSQRTIPWTRQSLYSYLRRQSIRKAPQPLPLSLLIAFLQPAG